MKIFVALLTLCGLTFSAHAENSMFPAFDTGASNANDCTGINRPIRVPSQEGTITLLYPNTMKWCSGEIAVGDDPLFSSAGGDSDGGGASPQ